MSLTKLTNQEQWIVAGVLILFILGGYTFFRFIPQNSHISSLQSHVSSVENKLLTSHIPDEPEDNVKELLTQLDDQEKSLALLTEMDESVSGSLAPFRSQELKVLISQLARNSRMRISTNEVYLPKKTLVKKKKKKKKKKSTTLETNLILDESRSWIDRMSLTTLFHRPMQRIVIEGNYVSLRNFIHGLDDLSWQVTIVKLNIAKLPSAPLQGRAQILRSELVLAL